MFDKLTKEDFRYFLINAKRDISYILDILDDEEALNILAYLHYEPADFKKLRKFFALVEKDRLSSYITNLWDFGIIELDKNNKYSISKLGKRFLEVTIQLVFEALLSHEITDPKMKKILIQKIGEKELAQFKKDRQENKAKGLQLGLRA
ncbi:MAG: hypothetical protein KAU62_13395 [Candidatus Heimdallarchaeota archaeon]|nr:hypothetical protein [Candidatus Heimdallarchaeota archaeon]MCG3257087.1 hypothetical protein [Candidatus Heimdallarchaeota archaeon]MCK4612147.1 hypothetical protein [Candidatus Heimdallarchaeota archaeon]